VLNQYEPRNHSRFPFIHVAAARAECLTLMPGQSANADCRRAPGRHLGFTDVTLGGPFATPRARITVSCRWTSLAICNGISNCTAKDADYLNLVGCWPRPNCGFEPAYGAKKKDHWPAPAEQALFVSPLRSGCSSRFKFNHRGEIAVARNNDAPAETTIKKLGLDHHTLTELRRNAIRGALNPASRQIKLTEARKLLADMQHAAAQLNAGIAAKLLPFCFAIEPALQREIRKLEGIMKRP
jgi:hypothetical protein